MVEKRVEAACEGLTATVQRKEEFPSDASLVKWKLGSETEEGHTTSSGLKHNVYSEN